MATLYERITGVGLGLSSEASEQKIAIHAFVAMVFEVHRGKFTGAESVAAFSLDAAQTADAQTFISYVNAAPDKLAYMRIFKDCAYLAETGVAYITQQSFVQRLQEAITDQGGTVP